MMTSEEAGVDLYTETLKLALFLAAKWEVDLYTVFTYTRQNTVHKEYFQPV